MFLFSLLVQKISSTIIVDSGAYGGGAYDFTTSGTIPGRDNTITSQGNGVYCEIRIGEKHKDLILDEAVTLDSLSVTIESEVNGDSVVMKYVVRNTGQESQTFSLGSYYDLEYQENGYDDSIVKVSDTMFYANHPQGVKIFHILDDTESYTGPNRHWYGIVSSTNPSSYYYKDMDNNPVTSGDLGIAFSYNDISVEGGHSVTLGIKFAFMTSIPDISFEITEDPVYREKDYMYFDKITVTNSKHGTIKIDLEGQTVKSKNYDAIGNTYEDTQIAFRMPASLKYKSDQYCALIYAEAEFPTSKKKHCFTYTNPPKIGDPRAESVTGSKQAKITVQVTDKDDGKTLYLFAKVRGSTSNNPINSITSNGNTQEISGTIDVTGQKGDIDILVWVSSKQSSTDTTDDTYYYKSDVKTTTLNLPTATKPTLTVNFPNPNTFPRNKKVKLTGTTTGEGEFTMKLILNEGTIEEKSVTNGDYTIEVDLPQDISLGEHTLVVYIVDGSGSESQRSETYTFTVQNTDPVIQDVSLSSNSVEGGEQVTITGKVKDIDARSTVTITATYDNDKSANTQVVSTGELQTFTITLTTEEVTSETTYEITIEANDNTGKYTYSPKPSLTVRVTKPKLSVTFPTEHEFPRNKKIHLTGTTTQNKEYTMKFIIDNTQIDKTQTIQNGQFNFDLDLPNSITLSEHSLVVFIVDGNNIESERSSPYTFTVQNSRPVVKDVSLDRNSVKGGEQVTISGKIQDIDPGSEVTIKAKNGENILGTTSVTSDGSLQPFSINYMTDDVIEETNIQINIEASDGKDTYTSTENYGLTVKVPIPTFEVTFPNPNNFPRNKKVHLKGTASGNGELTMKFYIDDIEMKKPTQVVQNGAYDFEFDLPSGLKNGPHQLIAYINDDKNRRSINSTAYEFNVENTRPVIEDFQVKKSTVVSGETVTITGKVKDIDSEGQITVTARVNDKETKQTKVESDGTMKPFTIEFPADEVTKDTTFIITVEANDGTDTYKLNTKITLTVTPKKVNPPPQPKPGPEKKDPNKDESDKDKDKKDSDKQDPGKDKDKDKTKDENETENETEPTSSQKERELEKQRRTYIIVGVVIGCLVVIAIVAGVSFYLLKKQGSSNTITEGGYQKDETMEP